METIRNSKDSDISSDMIRLLHVLTKQKPSNSNSRSIYHLMNCFEMLSGNQILDGFVLCSSGCCKDWNQCLHILSRGRENKWCVWGEVGGKSTPNSFTYFDP